MCSDAWWNHLAKTFSEEFSPDGKLVSTERWVERGQVGAFFVQIYQNVDNKLTKYRFATLPTRSFFNGGQLIVLVFHCLVKVSWVWAYSRSAAFHLRPPGNVPCQSGSPPSEWHLFPFAVTISSSRRTAGIILGAWTLGDTIMSSLILYEYLKFPRPWK